MILTIVLLLILILLGLGESYLHNINVKKVPIRILVNGTRGKTTTARLLTASLNAKGIRTLGRTTGSEAEVIYPDGHVEPFLRKRKATILEMKQIFRLAAEEKVDAVVVECMALQPENQRVMATSLVRPTHVIITNTYIDHVSEMGPTLDETVYALSMSVPKTAKLYVIEDYYNSLHDDTTVVEVPSSVPFASPIKIHPSSYALAKSLLRNLHIEEEWMAKGASSIKPDIGLHESFVGKKGALLLPTFSVNDLTCMDQTVKDALTTYPDKKVHLIYNNRQDREYRIQLMDKVIKRNLEAIDEVIVIGDYTRKVAHHFSRLKVKTTISEPKLLYERIDCSGPEDIYIGLANIKGKGEELLGYFLKEEKHA